MKKLFYFSLLGLTYNLLLLILPFVLFLLGISFSHNLYIDAFLWIYFIFLLSSPIFILVLAYRSFQLYHGHYRYMGPFLVSFLSFSPLWYLSIQFSCLWGIRDYLSTLSVPLFTAILACTLANFRGR